MRAPQEKTLAASCHFFNVIPVWGLIFCGGIWYAIREESRFVVGHARQAMVFHATLLVALLVWVLLGLVCRILDVISASFSHFLNSLNDGIMALFYVVYLAFCLLGCVRTFTGRPFHYPLVGIRE